MKARYEAAVFAANVCSGVKFQNKNPNDNPMSVFLESLIMPYEHTQEYALIRKYAHYAIMYVYVDLSTEWGELIEATLL